MSEREVKLSEEERERLFFQPFTSKGRQLRRPLSADEVAERVEQLIGARLADAEARAEAAVWAAAAVGWRLAHDEACSLGKVCSAHQPISAKAQRPRLAAALLADVRTREALRGDQ